MIALENNWDYSNQYKNSMVVFSFKDYTFSLSLQDNWNGLVHCDSKDKRFDSLGK
jgi:hypothetical protein